MRRIALLSSVTVFAAGLTLAPALGAPPPDSAEKVLSECGSNVPPELIDTCLERARVLDEAEPSPALESLEARLQQQAQIGGRPSQSNYGRGGHGGSDASGPPSNIAPGRPHELPPPRGYDPSGERSGSHSNDQPPAHISGGSGHQAPPPDSGPPPDQGPPSDADMPPPSGYGPDDQGPPSDADMPPPDDQGPPPPDDRIPPPDRDARPYDRVPPPGAYDQGPPDSRGPRDDDFTPDEPPVDDAGPPYPR